MKQAELSENEKQQLLAKLKLELTELEQQLELVHERSAPVMLDQQAVGRVSRIDAIQQQEMAQASEALMQQHIVRIKRIFLDTQEYGFCLECGESIGLGRLTIHPVAEMCIQCQSEAENC
ncbi:TraR/DksA C4-type zinc finger protein [Shewanella sp. D64]|uniref:TraR/DksA family transcriptional regulator n=1 Tax=unclassified Shewanella TaxID=196818 RepID=UPI0022BA4006|nr:MULTISPECIES: TraR/DksA C4-type zinc finger protein [unclassified Shewanella]MEC4724509.1 TraR/DksA C4-type zinc finger protein [Shewanella sp. D64]MEC4736714.1 TraR/DksA C4-type zinc finger protein [Shewanella sp. E94]WBJ94617.1 TraR/DksA C4-type zinc finger protein [Shewanella sp. MTB7]